MTCRVLSGAFRQISRDLTAVSYVMRITPKRCFMNSSRKLFKVAVGGCTISERAKRLSNGEYDQVRRVLFRPCARELIIFSCSRKLKM